MRTAVFPGTFDPITNGHVDVVKRGLLLFDRIIIAVGQNTSKQTLFPVEQRMEWIRRVFSAHPQVEVMVYEGLTVEFCRQQQAGFLLRGLRSAADFEYENHIAQVNRKLNPHVDTVFIISSPELSNLTSTVVRDVITYGGDYSGFVPPEVVV